MLTLYMYYHNVYIEKNWITCQGLKIFLGRGDMGRMDETRY